MVNTKAVDFFPARPTSGFPMSNNLKSSFVINYLACFAASSNGINYDMICISYIVFSSSFSFVNNRTSQIKKQDS